MTNEELIKMLDQNQQIAETLGGLRRAIISQGFSPEFAEAIILNQLGNKNKGETE